MSVIYVGRRFGDEGRAFIEWKNGEQIPLPVEPRPGRQYAGGHEWGYGGEGPHQLAWDILRHALRDSVAAAYYYRQFMVDHVQTLPYDGFRLTTQAILRWYSNQVAREQHPDPWELADRVEQGRRSSRRRPRENDSWRQYPQEEA